MFPRIVSNDENWGGHEGVVMTNKKKQGTIVVGGGLVGSLLSIFLKHRGHDVSIYEGRMDMRKAQMSAGRSINLIATRRGLHALAEAGLSDVVLDHAVPVAGRMIHKLDGRQEYQPYGKNESEVNYSVSRGELNKLLLSEASKAGVDLHFDHLLRGADLSRGILTFGRGDDSEVTVEAETIFGADGAGSAVRNELKAAPGFQTSYEDLGHGYKELLIPAHPDGSYQIERNALHIWPRGRSMLMALPNRDGSFTVTLYLPTSGPGSFEDLQTPAGVQSLFEEIFADSIPLIPDLQSDFFENPNGTLGTRRCNFWNQEGRVLLLGDAAHAVVPFFGQGMNSGFEDITVLMDLLEKSKNRKSCFSEFSSMRKPDADAIADMSLDNFYEMSERVGDPKFLLRKKVEHLLEKRFPKEYRSRYSMVAYTRIPYRVAQAAGRIQASMLDELCTGIDDAVDMDLDLARTLLREKLEPFLAEHSIRHTD